MQNQYSPNKIFSCFILALGAVSFIATLRVQAAPATAQSTPTVTTKLSENGKSLLPIVISAQAGEREKAAAQTLAEY
jgi:hypothetical protein